MSTMTYAQESFTVAAATTVTNGATGSFSFSASPTYPQYPDGPNPLSGTFDGQEITGFSTYGNPLNGVGLAGAGDPNYPNGNPYVGVSGILAQAGHLGDPSYQNGLSISLADGSAVHIYVVADASAYGGYSLAYETTTGASGVMYLDYSENAFLVGCFVRGTSIQSTAGEVPVEELREGDVVLTHSGVARPIRWIGRTAIRPAHAPHPNEVMPIRIRADAFGPGMPCRDLLLSPGHALLVGNVLINAGELVNGATIVQEDAELVHYYHVELDSHDILIADAMPCESYLDDGNRASFIGSAGPIRLHGRIDRFDDEHTCVPLIKDGPLLIKARKQLLARALELGWQLKERPDLRLEANGAVLEPISVVGPRHWFVLPDEPTATLRLRSSSTVVNNVDPGSADGRRLGVAIGELRIDGETRDLASSCFGAGFYPRENDGCTSWRWTDGDATLAIGWSARMIEVKLQMVMSVLRLKDIARQQATA